MKAEATRCGNVLEDSRDDFTSSKEMMVLIENMLKSSNVHNVFGSADCFQVDQGRRVRDGNFQADCRVLILMIQATRSFEEISETAWHATLKASMVELIYVCLLLFRQGL